MKKLWLGALSAALVVGAMSFTAMADEEAVVTVKKADSTSTNYMSVEEAFRNVGNSDTVVFHGAEVMCQSLEFPTASGVTYTSDYVGGTLMKYGIKSLDPMSGTTTFEKLTFDEKAIGQYAGADLTDLDLVIKNCTFNHAGGNCVYITPEMNSLTVTQCTFNGGNGSEGQYLVWPYYAHTIEISGNTFNGNSTRGAIHLGNKTESAVVSGNTIKGFERGVQVALSSGNVKIRDNTFDEIKVYADAQGRTAPVFIHSVTNQEETNVEVMNNTITASSTAVFGENGTNCVKNFEGNTVDGDAAGELTENTVGYTAEISGKKYATLADAMQAACNMNVRDVDGIPTQIAPVTIDLVNDVTIAEGISARGGSVSNYGQHYVHNIDITLDGHNHQIITGVSHSDIDGPTRTPSVGFASSNGNFTVKNVIAPDDLLFAVSRPGDVVSQCGHGTPLCAPAKKLLVEDCTFHGSNVGYLSGVETVTYRNNQFRLTENANDNANAYPIWYKFDYALPATFTFEGNTVISQRPVQIGRLASAMRVNVKNNNFTVANKESAAKAGALMLADIDGYAGAVTLTGNTVDADSAIILYNPSDNNTNFGLEVKDNTLRNGTKLLGYNSWSGSYNDPTQVADAEEKLENLLRQTAAETVQLAFEKVSDSVYNIVVRGKGGRYINRLTAVDLTFAIDNSDIAYAISPADKVTLTEENGRYLFNFDGVNAADASGSGIVIGKVEFTGFGGFEFNATAGVANTTKFADNIVDTFVSDAATEKGRFDITNADAVINTTLVPATHKLTINITFPNAISDQAAAYQNMKVVISGSDLAENLEYKLGTGENALALENGAYKLVVDGKLTENTAYTVTVSGAGYRTARYTVTMTADKTLNFWNNVKDTPAVVEEGKDASKKSVTFLAGDIVKDGKINIYDLSAVVSYFGTINDVSAESAYAKYDLNRDGKVDSKDVAYVLVSWGK